MCRSEPACLTRRLKTNIGERHINNFTTDCSNKNRSLEAASISLFFGGGEGEGGCFLVKKLKRYPGNNKSADRKQTIFLSLKNFIES